MSIGANASSAESGNLVDDDDRRDPDIGEFGQERRNDVERGRGCQHDGGLRVAQDRFEAFGVAGQFRWEQRDGDGSRFDGREESDDELQTLRGQDGHPVTAGRHPLHVSRDGTQSNTQFGPGQVDGVPVARTGEIQVAVCHRIGDSSDVAVDQRNQGDARWQHNAAGSVQAFLNLQQTAGTHVLTRTAHADSLGVVQIPLSAPPPCRRDSNVRTTFSTSRIRGRTGTRERRRSRVPVIGCIPGATVAAEVNSTGAQVNSPVR